MATRKGANRPAAVRRRVLSGRQLNRAVLGRQLLLRRVELPAAAAVHRLLGLNAQSPNLPYLALAARLDPFRIDDLTAAITGRVLVRSTLIRATQHLVSVADFRLIRPVVTPLLRRVRHNAFGGRTAGVDLDQLVARAVELLAGGRVATRPELGRALSRWWPDAEPTALGWTVQYLLPLVHPAPSGTWDSYGPTPFLLADWTGVPAAAGSDQVRELVRRYLAAFGPASVADIRAWSGVSGLREVVEELRPELRTYADESDRELFDLPDASLPDVDIPAPVRFLPEFDAPLLAYADRSRMMTDRIRREVCVGSGVAATVLVDGTVAAIWTEERSAGRAGDVRTLTVRPLRRLSATDREAIEAEGNRLLALTRPDATAREVRLLPEE